MRKVDNTLERLKIIKILTDVSRENKKRILVELASELGMTINIITAEDEDDALNIHMLSRYKDIDFSPEIKKVLEESGITINTYASEALIIFRDSKGDEYFYDLMLGVEGRVDGREMDDVDYSVVNAVIETTQDEIDAITSAIHDVHDTSVEEVE